MRLPAFVVANLLCGLAFGQSSDLQVTNPAPTRDHSLFTSEPAISLAGTLAPASGDNRVLWENSRGFSDLATVASDGHWTTTTPIPLRPGINHVRVKAPGRAGVETFVNIYYSPASVPPFHPLKTTRLHGQEITYEEIDGLAIFQGDIILGSVRDVAEGRFGGRLAHDPRQGLQPQSATVTTDVSSRAGLWPTTGGVAIVPYIITGGVDAAYITAAINQANTQLSGVVHWQARASEVNYVSFNLTSGDQSGTCQSSIGMVGGQQYVTGAGNCVTPTLIHEMGHAVGLFHEQSRNDRDGYVVYNESNIDKPQHGNFDKYNAGVDSGLFNYSSRMEYGGNLFARDGVSTVLESIPAGIPLSTSLALYTTGDMDGLLRLYGHAPTLVTIDTNPSGLSITVDGTNYPTTPQTFSWTPGSQHTLSVPLDAHNQTLQNSGGQNYIFGRWDAGPPNQQSVTITHTAGDGTMLRPTSSPAITAYVANFIPIHVFTPSVSHGTVSTTPAPSTIYIGNTLTNYFLDRQLVTITVTPNSGYNFYYWANVSLYNLYVNPYTFYMGTDFPSSATAVLTTAPITTITATAPDLTGAATVPGFAIPVISGGQVVNYASTPANFSTGDAGFSAGSTVTLCGSPAVGSSCPASGSAMIPVTYNIQYAFSNWTGDATASTDGLTFPAPASGHKTYVAHYAASFRSILNPSGSCAGAAVTANPSGTNFNSFNGTIDAFFNSGNVSFTATPGSGMSFAGWSQDFSGTTNPLSYPLNNQVLATANFNLTGIGAPLTISGVSGPAPTVTANAADITLTGSGFASSAGNLIAFFGPNGTLHSRSVTPVSSTQVTVHLLAGDLSAAGNYEIILENYLSSCSVQATTSLVVSQAPGPPVLNTASSHTGSFTTSQQNATYTVTVTNAGAGPTIEPVSLIESVPAGEKLVSMLGNGWTCGSGICTRSDQLPAGQSYPAITVTVNVAGNATSPQINSVLASGGGSYSASATDSTVINSQATVPNVAGLTQSAATTAIQSAGLTVGTVTSAYSNTVPLGQVISQNPLVGTAVALGSPVSFVVSLGPLTLQSITVGPVNPSIAKGRTQQFSASGTYADNSTQDLTAQVTWTSGNTAAATIGSTTGLATGVGPGSSKITATQGLVQGFTTLTVLNFSKCDVNQDTALTPDDVVYIVSKILTAAPLDLNGDGFTNVLDAQIVVNAAKSGLCSAT